MHGDAFKAFFPKVHTVWVYKKHLYKKHQLKFQEVKKRQPFKFLVLRNADHKNEGFESK